MASRALTSELEANNLMLTARDEAPVTALTLSGLYSLNQAKGILAEVSRTVQSSGWKFNPSTTTRWPAPRTAQSR